MILFNLCKPEADISCADFRNACGLAIALLVDKFAVCGKLEPVLTAVRL